MNLTTACVLFVVFLSCFVNAAEPAKLPPKEKMHIYILMGQSNMAGRGVIEKEDKTPNPHVLVFKTNDTWQVAVEPVTEDGHIKHGVGPALAFGKAMAEKDRSVTIGLVPTAVGGTPLKRWEKGADLYENSVQRAKLAMKDGILAGVLWHQGESNTGPKDSADKYAERLAKMISDLRADLGSPDLPFVVGELGEFLINRKKREPVPLAASINEQLNAIPSKVPHTACVSAKGLKDKGDELHFDSPSQRDFGHRYADIMWKLQHSTSHQ